MCYVAAIRRIPSVCSCRWEAVACALHSAKVYDLKFPLTVDNEALVRRGGQGPPVADEEQRQAWDSCFPSLLRGSAARRSENLLYLLTAAPIFCHEFIYLHVSVFVHLFTVYFFIFCIFMCVSFNYFSREHRSTVAPWAFNETFIYRWSPYYLLTKHPGFGELSIGIGWLVRMA